MKSDETFEAIAHPLRIKILELLTERPMGFSELKKELGIKSSGKLDFHLKKLNGLITLNEEGKYTLTKEGYAALQAIKNIRKFGWQKRAYIINAIIYVATASFLIWRIIIEGIYSIYTTVLVLFTLWFAYYSYWSIVKRGVFRVF